MFHLHVFLLIFFQKDAIQQILPQIGPWRPKLILFGSTDLILWCFFACVLFTSSLLLFLLLLCSLLLFHFSPFSLLFLFLLFLCWVCCTVVYIELESSRLDFPHWNHVLYTRCYLSNMFFLFLFLSTNEIVGKIRLNEKKKKISMHSTIYK